MHAPPIQTAQRPETAWVTSPAARAMRQCESSGDYRATNGTHFGAWQFDIPTAVSVGLYDVTSATPAAQDAAAYRLYLTRGLEPWDCAWAYRDHQ